MTESRWRPLTAFALVSLLCAVILAVNLGDPTARDVVTARQAGSEPSAPRVVFGDVLHSRASEAGSALGATLEGVGPLSDAVSRAPAASSTGGQQGTHRARQPKVHHQVRSHKAKPHHEARPHKARHYKSREHRPRHPKARHHQAGKHHKARHRSGRDHGRTRGHGYGNRHGWPHSRDRSRDHGDRDHGWGDRGRGHHSWPRHGQRGHDGWW